MSGRPGGVRLTAVLGAVGRDEAQPVRVALVRPPTFFTGVDSVPLPPPTAGRQHPLTPGALRTFSDGEYGGSRDLRLPAR